MRACPSHCRGAVFDEARERDLRVQPIIRNDRGNASRGQGLANEAITVLVAFLPAAAVEEHHHRAARRRLARGIDIQMLTSQLAVSDISVAGMAPRRRQRIDPELARAGRQQAGHEAHRDRPADNR